MSATPVADPYAVLGVAKDATLAAIRSAYRKLVLQTHPDKIQDESLRAAKQDEFQRVQQAYEILSDDGRRREYDDRLAYTQDRMDPVHDPASRYDVRSAAPTRDYEERKASNTTVREEDLGYFQFYEERISPKPHEKADRWDRRRFARSQTEYRKAPRPVETDFERSRIDRENQRQSNRESQSERRRTRDRERQSGRDDKYKHVDIVDDVDVDDYEIRFRTQVEFEDHHPRKKSVDPRRGVAVAVAVDEPPRRDTFRRRESENETYRKLSSAKEYMSKYVSDDYPSSSAATAEVDSPRRSSAARRGSDRDRDRERSSRRSKPSRKDSRDSRDYVEIVEPVAYDSPRVSRPVPSMPTSVSSPSGIRIPAPSSSSSPRVSSQLRSTTLQSPRESRPEPPPLSRSSTMPIPEKGYPSAPPSASRRRDPYLVAPSRLKTTVVEHDSGYSSPGTPETPQPDLTPTPSPGSRYIHVEDVEPKYATHSSRHRKATVEPDVEYDHGGRHRKVTVEPDDYDYDHDRRERSVSPHGRDRRSSEEPSVASGPRSTLARGSSSTSGRISPVRTYSYVYSSHKDVGEPAHYSRREPTHARSSSSRLSPVPSTARGESGGGGGGGGGGYTRGKLYGEIQYGRGIKHEDIQWSDSRRAAEAVYRDAAPPRSRSHYVHGPHPGLSRAETSI